MYIQTGLPTYSIAGLPARPGDILGRINPGSIIEHTFLVCFDGTIAHVSGPADVFRPGSIQEVLTPGAWMRVVSPTRSLAETQLRFARANRLMGVSWWNMDCHRTMGYVAGYIN
jgi:hypothetical protein